MMPTFKAIAILLFSLCATHSAKAQTLTAVLDDGTRLDVVAGTQVGSFLIRSDFGLLRSQGERISLLVDGGPEIRLLEPLRDLDYNLWAQRLGERGHLRRLFQEDPSATQCAAVFEALRIWGQRLDNLPIGTKRENRVRLLWERALQSEDLGLALIVGALEVEISPTLGQHERRISLVAWRKALHSSSAPLRWAAARVAAVQRDANSELDLLKAGFADEDLWVATAAARALYQIDPAGATYRWVYEMILSRDKQTQWRCAMQLAQWSRTDPKTPQRVADRMRDSTYLLQRKACQPGANVPLLGSEITENSILEVASPSVLMMSFIADTLERVAKSAEQPVPVAKGLSSEATAEEFEKAQAEAWRKLFMGR